MREDKMMRASKDFDKELENIILERRIRGIDKKQISRTKASDMIAKAPSFQQLKKELISEKVDLRKLR